jgi:hypothetical protein
VRHQTNDYSVHPKAVGRRVHVRVDDATLTVTLGAEIVARHERVLASHVTLTDPGHDRARQAARAVAGAPKPTDTDEVEVRDLAVYDRATGAA